MSDLPKGWTVTRSASCGQVKFINPPPMPTADQLTAEAERQGLQLVKRHRGVRAAGNVVWDVRDVARGTLAVKGATLADIANYLAPRAEATS